MDKSISFKSLSYCVVLSCALSGSTHINAASQSMSFKSFINSLYSRSVSAVTNKTDAIAAGIIGFIAGGSLVALFFLKKNKKTSINLGGTLPKAPRSTGTDLATPASSSSSNDSAPRISELYRDLDHIATHGPRGLNNSSATSRTSEHAKAGSVDLDTALHEAEHLLEAHNSISPQSARSSAAPAATGHSEVVEVETITHMLATPATPVAAVGINPFGMMFGFSPASPAVIKPAQEEAVSPIASSPTSSVASAPATPFTPEPSEADRLAVKEQKREEVKKEYEESMAALRQAKEKKEQEKALVDAEASKNHAGRSLFFGSDSPAL